MITRMKVAKPRLSFGWSSGWDAHKTWFCSYSETGGIGFPTGIGPTPLSAYEDWQRRIAMQKAKHD